MPSPSGAGTSRRMGTQRASTGMGHLRVLRMARAGRGQALLCEAELWMELGQEAGVDRKAAGRRANEAVHTAVNVRARSRAGNHRDAPATLVRVRAPRMMAPLAGGAP